MEGSRPRHIERDQQPDGVRGLGQPIAEALDRVGDQARTRGLNDGRGLPDDRARRAEVEAGCGRLPVPGREDLQRVRRREMDRDRQRHRAALRRQLPRHVAQRRLKSVRDHEGAHAVRDDQVDRPLELQPERICVNERDPLRQPVVLWFVAWVVLEIAMLA